MSFETLYIECVGQRTFSPQVWRERERILNELCIENYTWQASSEPRPDLDDIILDFELML